MNERIRELARLARNWAHLGGFAQIPRSRTDVLFEQKFAELIVEECRRVVTEVYRETPLELCGPLLTADEAIAKHFYGVEE